MNPTEKSNVQLRESIESKDVARISLGVNFGHGDEMEVKNVMTKHTS